MSSDSLGVYEGKHSVVLASHCGKQSLFFAQPLDLNDMPFVLYEESDSYGEQTKSYFYFYQNGNLISDTASAEKTIGNVMNSVNLMARVFSIGTGVSHPVLELLFSSRFNNTNPIEEEVNYRADEAMPFD